LQAKLLETSAPLMASLPEKVPDLPALMVPYGFCVTSHSTPRRAPDKLDTVPSGRGIGERSRRQRT